MNSGLNIIRIPLYLSILLLIGCRQKPDLKELRAEIRSRHAAGIEAHLNKDVDFFIDDLSGGFIEVSDGDIKHPTREEIRSRFEDYLTHTTFTEYRDLREPIIGISKDGSIAWSIVRVKVAGTRKMEDDTERDLDFTCAWMTLYERKKNRWIRFAEVSNFN